MQPTLNEKFIAYLALISGLTISVVAEYYSILGLTAIFAAAVIPVIIMGIALGVGKITATVWLKQNWTIAPWSIRIYLGTAILVLMVITSMGIFGFLSKAHSDQSLISGDVTAKIAVYDEKIKTAKENIDANRKALKQMDEAVDQVMGRSQDEKGADKAVALRRGQAKERTRLLSEIAAEQKVIAQLSEERAPIAAEIRKVEAEVGPIKYIAAFVYGETDQTILEKAVTWVIIILIIVFDPLAVILLLASQISFQNFREREMEEHLPPYIYENFEKPTVEELAEIEEEGDSPLGPEPVVDDQKPTVAEIKDPHPVGWMYHYDAPPLYPSTEAELEELIEASKNVDKYAYLKKPWVDRVPEEFRVGPQVYKPENPIVEVITTATDESLFVQNEEQKESGLWTKTIESISPEEYSQTSLSRQELTLNEWIEKIKTGQIQMTDVPEHLLLDIRARI